jgi:hypothetical protein
MKISPEKIMLTNGGMEKSFSPAIIFPPQRAAKVFAFIINCGEQQLTLIHHSLSKQLKAQLRSD